MCSLKTNKCFGPDNVCGHQQVLFKRAQFYFYMFNIFLISPWRWSICQGSGQILLLSLSPKLAQLNPSFIHSLPYWNTKLTGPAPTYATPPVQLYLLHCWRSCLVLVSYHKQRFVITYIRRKQSTALCWCCPQNAVNNLILIISGNIQPISNLP